MADKSDQDHDPSAPSVDDREKIRPVSKHSHDDTDNLVVSLYHHLIRACHIYLPAIDHPGRNLDVKLCSQHDKGIEATQLGGHEIVSAVADESTVEKSSSAEQLSQDCIDRKRSRTKLGDAITRLLLWGDVIRGGRSATLAVVSQGLYHNVVELLHSCGRDLQELHLCLNDKVMTRTEVTESLRDLDTWLEKTTFMLYDSKDFSGDRDITADAQASRNPIPTPDDSAHHQFELIESFEESVAMLMDLTPTIEDALALQVFLDAEDRVAVADFKATDAAQLWVARIAESYKSAPRNLVQRLGEANWQRYCRLRVPKAATTAEQPSRAKSAFHEQVSPNAETVDDKSATSSSVFHDSALGPSVHSMIEYAQSNASHSSLLSRISDPSRHFYRVPPEPQEVTMGEPFLCLLCKNEVSGIYNRIQWKMHVFHDLRPYICLADNCSDLLRTFPTRNAWAEHDRSHRQKDVFECRDCQFACSTSTQFANHLSQNHAELNFEEQRKLTATVGRTQFDHVELWSCPLCDTKIFGSTHKFRSHVCQHLEDIALAAVPSELYPDDDADSVASEDGWISPPTDEVDGDLVVTRHQNPGPPTDLIEWQQKFARLLPEIQTKVKSLFFEHPPSISKGSPAAALWKAEAHLRYGQAIQRAQKTGDKRRELRRFAQTRTIQGSPLTQEEHDWLNDKIQACDKAIRDSQDFIDKFNAEQESYQRLRGQTNHKGKNPDQDTMMQPSVSDRSYPCTFHHFGCNMEFANKNEWKRHVAAQHLQLGYYRCDFEGCNPPPASTFPRSWDDKQTAAKKPQTQIDGSSASDHTEEATIMVFNDFNRKDVFTQHCRRMHGPSRNPAFCTNPVRKQGGLLDPTKEDEAAFEQQLDTIRERCWRVRRHPPKQTTCGFCGKVFDDSTNVTGIEFADGEIAWGRRMEHVARHYEVKGVLAKEEAIDDDLVKWGLETGVLRTLPDGRPWLMACEDPET